MRAYVLLLSGLLCVTNIHAGWFSPDNYWECLLKEMRQVHTDTVAQEVVSACKKRYSLHERVFTKQKQHWFGPHTSSECVLKYGKNIRSELAAKYIQSACYKLYPQH